jgi:hypothetical protein
MHLALLTHYGKVVTMFNSDMNRNCLCCRPEIENRLAEHRYSSDSVSCEKGDMFAKLFRKYL